MWELRWLIVLLLLTLLVIGCNSENYTPTTETVHYVGVVDKLDTNIGIAVKNDHFTAFVCDEDGYGGWIHGTISSDGVLETDAYLRATIRGTSIDGTYSPTSTLPPSFYAEVATGNAGVYRLEENVDGEHVISGWVMLNDGHALGCRSNDGYGYGYPLSLVVDSDAVWIEPEVKP